MRVMPHITYRLASGHSDLQQIERLYSQSYDIDMSEGTVRSELSNIEAGIAMKDVVVAEENDAIIGFGEMKSFSQIPAEKDELVCILKAGLYADMHDMQLLLAELSASAFGLVEYAFEIFENQFSMVERFVDESDMLFASLLVHPEWRGRGIGSRLVEERIAIARSRGVGACYTHALENSGSRKIYKRLGFSPVAFRKPVDVSGLGAMTMGMVLK